MNNSELLKQFDLDIGNGIDKKHFSLDNLCKSYNLCDEGYHHLRNYGLRVIWAHNHYNDELKQNQNDFKYFYGRLITTIPLSLVSGSVFSLGEYLLNGETDFQHNLKMSVWMFGNIELWLGPFRKVYQEMHKNELAAPYQIEVTKLREYTTKKLDELVTEK